MMFILIELLFLIDVLVKAKIQIYSDTQSQFNYFNVEQNLHRLYPTANRAIIPLSGTCSCVEPFAAHSCRHPY